MDDLGNVCIRWNMMNYWISNDLIKKFSLIQSKKCTNYLLQHMRERREREIEKRSYLKFESEKEEAHRFFWCFFLFSQSLKLIKPWDLNLDMQISDKFLIYVFSIETSTQILALTHSHVSIFHGCSQIKIIQIICCCCVAKRTRQAG